MSSPSADRSAFTWRKARASGQGNCVEVASARDSVAIRDSKDPDGAVLFYRRAEWAAFIARIKAGN